MDEQDLRQFQQYVKEFSNVAGDKRTSQGLANLVMIQKELGGQKLSPVQLDDDRVYSTSKSGSLGLVRDMKVQLAGSTDETFTPLIEGLRRSTLNVRLKNSFRDIIDPLVSELQIQQLEKMTYENELHREDVIYYRQIIHAIDNLGKTNQHSFLDSVLVGYRRFVRNPIWTSLSFAVNTLRKAIVGPIFGILTGWREKSDTQKIIDSINKQTEFLRTGKIGAQGFMEKFTEGGVLGVIGKSISDTFKAAFGKDAASSPQQQTNTLLTDLIKSTEKSHSLLEKIIVGQRAQITLQGMTYDASRLTSVSAERIVQGLLESNKNMTLVAQKQAANDEVFALQKQVANGTTGTTSNIPISQLRAIRDSMEGNDKKTSFDPQKEKREKQQIEFASTASSTLNIMAAAQHEYYEEVAQEQLEEQRQQTKELSEHNRREKRRTLFSVLKAALPGVLGILGLGAAGAYVWNKMPDETRKSISGAVKDGVRWGFGNLFDYVTDTFDYSQIAMGIGGALMFVPPFTKVGAILLGMGSLIRFAKYAERELGLSRLAGPDLTDVPDPDTDFFRRHGSMGEGTPAAERPGFDLAMGHLSYLNEKRRQLESDIEEARQNRDGFERSDELITLNEELKTLNRRMARGDASGLVLSHAAIESAIRLNQEQDSSGGSSSAPQGRTTNKTQFMDRYGSMITQIANDLGVDPSIIAGQFALETGWGRSLVGNNNLGNIKAGSSWDGEVVFAHDKAEGSYDPYRSYGSPEEFAADYSSMIRRNFPGAVGAGSDVGAFAGGMQSGRYGAYATDPNYADKLSSVVKSVPSSGPSLSQSTIDSATSRVTNTPSGSSDNFVNKLLGNISQGITTLIEVTKERGESSPFGSSDRGTSHAAYGE